MRIHASAVVRTATALAMMFSATSASALVAYIDDFRIIRSNLAYVTDTFDDGVVPPTVPGAFNCGTTAPNCYSVTGSFNSGDESGGKLRMDTSLGDLSESSTGAARIVQNARLITNRSDDPVDINAGLKKHRTFSASAIFDLVLPGPGEQYQVRFTDSHANAADAGHRTDFLALAVRRAATDGAQPEIRFFEQNYAADTLVEIGATPLNVNLGADQIRLTLNHAVADSTEIIASWDYLNAGNVVQSGSFAARGNIFDGETWTRADFIVSAPVPEPQSYALMLGGLALIGWRLQRRKIPT